MTIFQAIFTILGAFALVSAIAIQLEDPFPFSFGMIGASVALCVLTVLASFGLFNVTGVIFQ